MKYGLKQLQHLRDVFILTLDNEDEHDLGYTEYDNCHSETEKFFKWIRLNELKGEIDNILNKKVYKCDKCIHALCASSDNAFVLCDVFNEIKYYSFEKCELYKRKDIKK